VVDYYSCPAQISERFIKAGAGIRLHHRQGNGFLCAFKEAREEPHVYISDPAKDDGKGAASLWEIEMLIPQEDGAFLPEGGNISWTTQGAATQYRLRHMQTRKFLYMTSTMVGLRNDRMEGTVLNLVSQTRSCEDNISEGVLVFLKSPSVGAFVATPTERHGTIECVVSHSVPISDAFTLHSVKQKEEDDVIHILTAIPIIQEYVATLRQIPKDKYFSDDATEFVGSEIFKKAVKALSDLIFFATYTHSNDPFTCEGLPQPAKQECFRDLQVVELLVECLAIPFGVSPEGPFEKPEGTLTSGKAREAFDHGPFALSAITKSHPIIQICTLVNRLLLHIFKGNPRNEVYVARWINLFVSQAIETNHLNDIKAESTVSRLVDKNIELLNSHVSDEMIRRFIELIQEQEKDDKYLLLLAALTSCNDTPIPSTQLSVVNHLLRSETNKAQIVVDTSLNKDELQIAIPGYGKPLKLIELVQRALHDEEAARMLAYYTAQCQLLAQCCLGKFAAGVEEVEKVLTKEVVYRGMSDEKLHEYPTGQKLQAQFCHMMRHCHVNRPGVHRVIIPQYTRTMASLSLDPIPPTGLHVELKGFMTKYFLGFKGGCQKAWETAANELILSLLCLLDTMFETGSYRNSYQVEMVIDPLISFLDGQADMTSPLEDVEGGMSILDETTDRKLRNARYARTENTALIHDAKVRMCDLLLFVNTMRLDQDITSILYFLSQAIEPGGTKDIDLVNATQNDQKSENGAKLNTGTGTGTAKVAPSSLSAFEESELITDAAQAAFSKVFKHTEARDESTRLRLDLNIISKKDLVMILIDCTMYQTPELVNMSFKLLVQHFSQQEGVLTALSKVRILKGENTIQA